MTKFHINSETGRVNICRATVQACPIGSADDHYTSKEAAYEAREAKYSEEIGTFATQSKKQPSEAIASLQRELTSIDPKVDAQTARELVELYKKHRFESSFITAASKLVSGDGNKLYEKVQRFQSVDSARAQDSWNVVRGEGAFKRIVDDEGNSLGSIQNRDGFYILGARDTKTRRLVSFGSINSFETTDDAVDSFKKWAHSNMGMNTTA